MSALPLAVVIKRAGVWEVWQRPHEAVADFFTDTYMDLVATCPSLSLAREIRRKYNEPCPACPHEEKE